MHVGFEHLMRKTNGRQMRGKKSNKIRVYALIIIVEFMRQDREGLWISRFDFSPY
jgi:hypothetical protein